MSDWMKEDVERLERRSTWDVFIILFYFVVAGCDVHLYLTTTGDWAWTWLPLAFAFLGMGLSKLTFYAVHMLILAIAASRRP